MRARPFRQCSSSLVEDGGAMLSGASLAALHALRERAVWRVDCVRLVGAVAGPSMHHARGSRLATWRSGDAADCKSVYPGSIPGVASTIISLKEPWQGLRAQGSRLELPHAEAGFRPAWRRQNGQLRSRDGVFQSPPGLLDHRTGRTRRTTVDRGDFLRQGAWPGGEASAIGTTLFDKSRWPVPR